jgi:hypothetical protein
MKTIGLLAVLTVLGCGGQALDPADPMTSAMTWTFTNNCAEPMNVRLFDRNNAMTWPADVPAYRVLTEKTATFAVRCIAGAQVLYGASTDTGGALGAGLDGAGTCAGCAFICGHDAPTPIALECP